MGVIPPVAFVLPWYGPEVAGGAETDARHLAENLRSGDLPVEVWTTTVRDLGADWNHNHHRPGQYRINGVPVRRFSVTPVQRTDYSQIHRRLARGGRLTAREEALFFTQSVRSQALMDYIEHQKGFICAFSPYFIGTTYWGVYAAGKRTLLIPCLHDEGFARLVALAHMFRSARGILCNAPAEKDLVQRLYGVAPDRIAVIGDGIQVEARGQAQAFRQRFGVEGPFLLYAGRKSWGKNTHLLITYFERYLERRQTPLRLVLIGPGRIRIPQQVGDRILDLGYVSECDKLNAFAAATLFCQPSVNESFSLVLMEAWVEGTPALVNARCDVTREHCEMSHGGLYFEDYTEFEAALDLLSSSPRLRDTLADQGRRYVKTNFTWDQVVDRFIQAVQTMGPWEVRG
jgi:glycosyltransferase involved in cell wall biosynthesis